MDATHSFHPDDRTLGDYGLGKLDDELATTINAHLEACPDCRRRVAGLTSDSFLGRLQDARKPSDRGGSLGGGTLSFLQGRAPSPPPSTDTLPPGLADHQDYEIRRELGRGGMGVVYLAHNTMMGRDEVLKVMGRQIMDRPAVLERFQREIRAVARLRHPNIVAAYTAFRIEGGLVFAMEYVEGLDLSRLVRTKGPLAVTHASYFIHQAALGLQHAHEKGMVHRDIKPHNLMLTHDGKARVVKVLDFGLAKANREQEVDGGLTSEGQALGTPDYIAPEQIMNAPEVDIRADLYSLGGTLFYLLTGRPPFQANSLYDIYQAHISRDVDPLNLIRPEVPSELAALVAKMMAKDPKRRFQTPAGVAEALKPFFKSKAIQVQPETSQAGPAGPRPLKVVERPAPTEPATIAPTSVNRPTKPPVTSKPKPERPIDFDDRELVEEPLTDDEPGRPRWFWRTVTAAAVLSVLLIAWLTWTFKVKTEDGVIVLEDVPKDAQILVDGKKITFIWPGDDKPVEIRAVPGEHELEVEREGFKTFGRKVSFKTNGSEVVTVRLESDAEVIRGVKNKANTNEGILVRGSKPSTQPWNASWVSLFNGKDLDGWEDIGPWVGSWKVENGVLKGTIEDKNRAKSVLATRRSTFKNFRLRVVYGGKDRGLGYNWIIARHAKFKKKNSNEGHSGYMITANGRIIEVNAWQIGFVFPKSPEVHNVVPTRANDWNVLEIEAVKNLITTSLNGERVTEYRDNTNWYSEGSIALNCTAASPVRIREISIQELPDGAASSGKPNLSELDVHPAGPLEKGAGVALGGESPATRATDPVGGTAFDARADPIGGEWSIDGDELVQSSLAGREGGAPYLVFGDASLSHYDLTLEAMRTGGTEAFFIQFHRQDGRNKCLFSLGRYRNKGHDLERFIDGRNTREKDDYAWGSIDVGRWYLIKVEVRGPTYRCYLDGKLLFETTDTRLDHGRIGLACFDSQARYRKIRVQDVAGTTLFEGLPRLPSTIPAAGEGAGLNR